MAENMMHPGPGFLPQRHKENHIGNINLLFSITFVSLMTQPKCVKAANPKPFDRIHRIHRIEFLEKSCKSC
jgi:hypothetical protein